MVKTILQDGPVQWGRINANGMNIRYTGYAVDSLRWSRANTIRILVRDLSESAAPANTAENSLRSFFLDKDEYLVQPASNYLGKKILVRASGSIVGTAGTKSLRVRISGTAVSGLVVPAAYTGRFVLETEIFLTARAAQTTYSSINLDSGNLQSRSNTTVDLGDGADKELSFSVQKVSAGDTISVQRFEIECDG